MKITMIGSGYVGLVSGACFADFGHDVVCVDLDEAKIEALRGGKVPIFEPGLADLIERNARAGRISFTTELAPAVARAEVVFIAVGPPSRRGDGHADLSFVEAAAAGISGSGHGLLEYPDVQLQNHGKISGGLSLGFLISAEQNKILTYFFLC